MVAAAFVVCFSGVSGVESFACCYNKAQALAQEGLWDGALSWLSLDGYFGEGRRGGVEFLRISDMMVASGVCTI